MQRILKTQFQLLKQIEVCEQTTIQRDYPLSWERVHLGSCAAIGQLLALKRGINPELAAIACAIHDYGRIITGKQVNHATNGYLPVKEFLNNCGFFTDIEIEQLAIAVKKHSNKAEFDTPLDEIVKDADVLDCYHYGQELSRPEQRERLAKIYQELELNR